MVYGYETLEDNDPFIASANKVLSHADEGTQPGNLVELMPWCSYWISIFISTGELIAVFFRVDSAILPSLVSFRRLQEKDNVVDQ